MSVFYNTVVIILLVTEQIRNRPLVTILREKLSKEGGKVASFMLQAIFLLSLCNTKAVLAVLCNH